MNNFFTRTITGILFVTLIVTTLVYEFIPVPFLFGAAALFTLSEFYNIVSTKEQTPQKVLGSIMAIIILFIFWEISQGRISAWHFYLFFPFVSLLFVTELFRNKPRAFINIAITILGLMYCVVPFASINFLAFPAGLTQDYTSDILLGMFILLWANDTGAYLAGITLGKHKLFERISPKKTVEGFVGGIVFAMVGCYVNSIFFNLLSTFDWYIIGVIVIVFGTLGDLAESLLKRNYDIKDSGNILPGHGGILDRFDGVLLTIPLVVAYIYIKYAV